MNASNPDGQIIDADVHHLEKMLAIFTHGQNYHHQMFPDIFCAPDDKEDILNYLRSFLKPRNPFRDRRNFASVWMINNEVGGYLLYQKYQTSNVFFGKNRWNCFIDDIAVAPEFHGRGGASLLLASLMEETSKLEGCLINAQVWRGNEASENLFNKFDFKDKAKNFTRLM